MENMQDPPTDTLTFHAICDPRPKGSKSAFVRGGRAILVEASASLPIYMKHIAHEARSALGSTEWVMDGWYALAVTFTIRQPTSHLTISGDIKPRFANAQPSRPDTDKMVRAVCDALTGVTWDDDGRVIWVLASKRYGPEARTDITIWRRHDIDVPEECGS